MGAHSTTWLVAGLALMGLLECDPYVWGTHPGKVCAGEEISLEPIAKGAELAGWWKYVPPHEKASPPLDLDFLFIDEELRPRAWSERGGADYEENPKERSGWNFGCRAFVDYPLVVGAENRAPSSARMTVPTGCSFASYKKDPSGRRVLDRVYFREGMMCLAYDRWHSSRYPEESFAASRSLCFEYDSSTDHMVIAYLEDEKGPLIKHRYERYDEEAQDEEEKARGQDSSWGKRGSGDERPGGEW